MSEPVKLNLLEAYVLPVLSYAIEAVPLSNGQCNDLNICWNNIYRKIFGMNKWESVKQLQYFCERLNFVRLYHLRKLRFIQKAFNSDNRNLSHCITCFQYSDEFRSLCDEYDLSVNINGVNIAYMPRYVTSSKNYVLGWKPSLYNFYSFISVFFLHFLSLIVSSFN